MCSETSASISSTVSGRPRTESACPPLKSRCTASSTATARILTCRCCAIAEIGCRPTPGTCGPKHSAAFILCTQCRTYTASTNSVGTGKGGEAPPPAALSAPAALEGLEGGPPVLGAPSPGGAPSARCGGVPAVAPPPASPEVRQEARGDAKRPPVSLRAPSPERGLCVCVCVRPSPSAPALCCCCCHALASRAGKPPCCSRARSSCAESGCTSPSMCGSR
mmetsp:Transcript_10851/g.28167  ORF Transcript_10851/g.28167 Transcript_10851/m.28167 type:complete len:221 (+) Transcript_10851:358-1020(+)